RLTAPIWELLPLDQAAIGARARILRWRGRDDECLQARVDAIAGNDEIGSGGAAVVKFQVSDAHILLEADATVAGADRARRQHAGKNVEEIGAMHAVHAVPAARIRWQHLAQQLVIHAVT